MPITAIREDIKIDSNHVDLLYGLLVSAKPKTILEFGLGRAVATDRILSAILYNGIPVRYTVVDNWKDFGGTIPGEARTYALRVNLVTEDEGRYIAATNERYDFILCDGDHFNSEKYFDDVYDRLLNSPGIVVYHDVVGAEFPNLHSIPRRARERGLSSVVFDKPTRPDEHCERGLLVVFKP
jgi:predicted O-methyltransferase YrrM